MLKALLTTTTVLELATGIGLVAVPEMVSSILLGEALGASAGVVVARIAGAALISLAIACWMGRRDTRSRVALGIVAAMLFYNVAVIVLLLAARYGMGLSSIGLIPAALLHAALTVWCVVCLREGVS
jgi:riboflavin transporter FmnP